MHSVSAVRACGVGAAPVPRGWRSSAVAQHTLPAYSVWPRYDGRLTTLPLYLHGPTAGQRQARSEFRSWPASVESREVSGGASYAASADRGTVVAASRERLCVGRQVLRVTLAVQPSGLATPLLVH